MIRRLLLTLVLIGLIVGPSQLLTSSTRATAAAMPTWVTWNAATKTASVTLIADYNEVAGGFNFNGYNNGGLVMTIPTGAHVMVTFTNKSAQIPHSAVITPYAKHTLAGNFPLAFPGSTTPNPGSGVTSSNPAQKFTFVANKAGQYAVVCGVPGHALAGMWIKFVVANVAGATAGTGSAPAQSTGSGMTAASMCGMADMHNGAVAGDVTDAVNNKPMAHVLVVVGWTTQQRVGETDAMGHYCITHLTPAYVDAFGFAQGYVYYHGHPISIHAGKAVTYSFKMALQAFPKAQLPVLSGATISAMSVAAGSTATFSVHVTPGKPGQMSPEVFAANSALGHSVLLQHRGSDVYSGTWTVPAGTKPGTYTFSFFGAMVNCLENAQYQTVTLTVTK